MFAEIALSFPTVIFTVLVGVSTGYWILSAFAGVGFDGLDLDLDTDLDLDVDGGDIDAGGLGSLLDTLHLTGVPPMIILSITSILAWFISYSVQLLTSLDGAGLVGFALSAALVIVSSILGLLGASVVARPLAKLFLTATATTNQALVGRTCIIRTGSVTDQLGQAELRAPDGTEQVVQVRVMAPSNLKRGDTALLYDYDSESGIFQVSPLDLEAGTPHTNTNNKQQKGTQ